MSTVVADIREAPRTGGESGWPGEPDDCLVLDSVDGVRLHVESYRPKVEGAAVLLFLHGIGAYAGPCRRFAAEMSREGIAVFLPDLRGHGRSGPRPGAMGTPSAVLDDIEVAIEHAKASYPRREIVLGGESMGALVALAYAASPRLKPDRLVLLCPALSVQWRNILRSVPRPEDRERGRRIGPRGFPLHLPVTGEPLADPSFKRTSQDDPLMLQYASLPYLMTIARFQVAWASRYPAKVCQPCLLLQGGEDGVLSLDAARLLDDLLPDGELRVVGGAWHNLLWDPSWESTTRLIAGWLSGSPGSGPTQ